MAKFLMDRKLPGGGGIYLQNVVRCGLGGKKEGLNVVGCLMREFPKKAGGLTYVDKASGLINQESTEKKNHDNSLPKKKSLIYPQLEPE